MNRFLCLVLLLILALAPCTHAQDVTPLDYVLSKGFTVAEQFESPGWNTCYLIENDEGQGLSFSDDTYTYSVVALPALDLNFDPSALRSLFFDLAASYEWDVSYYWPEYDTTDKITVSYGIEKDLDLTLANYSSKDEYLPALCSSLGLPPSTAVFAALGIKKNAITKWFETESLVPDRTMPVDSTEKPPCASYYIAPHAVIVRSGASDHIGCGLPEDLSDAQVMSMYGRLLDYVRQNAINIGVAGLVDGSTGCNVLMVAELGDESQYIGIYDVLDHSFVVEYSPAE